MHAQPPKGKHSPLSGAEYPPPYHVRPWEKLYLLGSHRHVYSFSLMTKYLKMMVTLPLNLLFSQSCPWQFLNYYLDSMVSTCLSLLHTLHRWVSVKTLVPRVDAMLNPRAERAERAGWSLQWSESLWCVLKSHSSNHLIWEPCPPPFVLPVNENFYVHPRSYLWAIENISSWIMQKSKCTL